MNKKNMIIIAAAIVAVLIGVVLFLILGRALEDNEHGVEVYFFNSAQGQLEAEFRELPQMSSVERIETALLYFSNEPESSSLVRAIPSNVQLRELITEIFIENGVLIAMMSEIYDEISTVEDLLFRSAFTLTMVGLPGIESVKFVSADGSEFVESAATIANNPHISPARRTAEDFTLYYVDESGEGLTTVLYESADVNVHRRSSQILELLMEGQNEAGILPMIPPETRVRDVMIELDAGIYVDLSAEFHSRFSGNATQARLMLQSITHTMLENNPGPPRRVFFLIDSVRLDDFHGVSDFNLGFTIDETVMLGYVPAEEIEN
ncbi:MAG: GerMN domain-containing protein [Clostridiales bacterium]|jgi:spore germination protein GerM|nr:GerMN domain-containing protein [Clostridiales bacterium]